MKFDFDQRMTVHELEELYREGFIDQSADLLHCNLVTAGLRDRKVLYPEAELSEKIAALEAKILGFHRWNLELAIAYAMDLDYTNAVAVAAWHERFIAEEDECDSVRVICRLAPRPKSTQAFEGTLPSEIVWMPAGTHAIEAGTVSGGGWAGVVTCDQDAFEAVAESFAKAKAAGRRVYLDLNHESHDVAEVTGFSWDPERGIICAVEWTSQGEAAVRNRIFESFSPTFNVSKRDGQVIGLVDGQAAGALVNRPAFADAMPSLLPA